MKFIQACGLSIMQATYFYLVLAELCKMQASILVLTLIVVSALGLMYYGSDDR